MNTPNTTQKLDSKSLPATLMAFEQQLEQIRQEQLARNRSALRTLGAEQQQWVELLTRTIIRKIFDEVMQESIAEASETRISEIITLMWGMWQQGGSHSLSNTPVAQIPK